MAGKDKNADMTLMIKILRELQTDVAELKQMWQEPGFS
jgi:hypothetical protein